MKDLTTFSIWVKHRDRVIIVSIYGPSPGLGSRQNGSQLTCDWRDLMSWSFSAEMHLISFSHCSCVWSTKKEAWNWLRTKGRMQRLHRCTWLLAFSRSCTSTYISTGTNDKNFVSHQRSKLGKKRQLTSDWRDVIVCSFLRSSASVSAYFTKWDSFCCSYICIYT